MIRVRICEVADFEELGERWRDLEQRSACSFFQSWSWTGCLARERFNWPLVVEATEGGRTVALALFNRTRPIVGLARLHLGEAGDRGFDSPYIEDNGVLAEAGREGALTEVCVRAVTRSRLLVASGIRALEQAAVRRGAGRTYTTHEREAPFANLEAVRRAGGDYLATRSANTRQQVRRSDRFYAAGGDLTLDTAETPQAAHAMLDSMAALHQASWTERGQPGSFAAPFFGRFHHMLIDRAAGQVALMAVRGGGTLIGILYNFVYRGRMSAYQSGFDYGAAGRHGKPGLTCHHAAIQYAMLRGMDVYDFLAGDDRYKRSLGDSSDRMYWLEAGPAWSPRLLAARTRDWLRG